MMGSSRQDMTNRGEKLINEIVTGSTHDIGVATNRLLAEFAKGLSLDHLKSLLTSDQPEVVKSGIWIASELGARAKPIAAQVGRLLNHRDKYVRFFAIDSLLTTTDQQDGELIAGVIALLSDESEAVRQKALDFLVRASSNQLEGAAAWLDTLPPPGADLAAKLRWLTDRDRADREGVIAWLTSASASDRRFGAAAALRHGLLDGEILAQAANSPDPETRGIVKSELATRQRRAEHEARFQGRDRGGRSKKK